jgi:hypothetical protein
LALFIQRSIFSNAKNSTNERFVIIYWKAMSFFF